jgi:hypothetical protein
MILIAHFYLYAAGSLVCLRWAGAPSAVRNHPPGLQHFVLRPAINGQQRHRRNKCRGWVRILTAKEEDDFGKSHAKNSNGYSDNEQCPPDITMIYDIEI